MSNFTGTYFFCPAYYNLSMEATGDIDILNRSIRQQIEVTEQNFELTNVALNITAEKYFELGFRRHLALEDTATASLEQLEAKEIKEIKTEILNKVEVSEYDLALVDNVINLTAKEYYKSGFHSCLTLMMEIEQLKLK